MGVGIWGGVVANVLRRKRGRRTTVTVGSTLGPVGTVFRREAPDGRAFSVAFHHGRRVWRVKQSGDDRVYEAPRLRDALADSLGSAEDEPWIGALARELTEAAGVAAEVPERG